ncbi:MAG: PAS domain S-box protein [Anaerolineae bacterium]|nr:PAS domain S-box protein [Anaerolineae bacterium]
MDIRFLIFTATGLGLGLLVCAARRLWFAPLEAAGRHLIDHAADGIILLDRKGRVLHLNTSAANLLGVDPRQVIRRPWSSLFAGQTTLEPENIDTHSDWTQALELTGEGVHRHVTLRASAIYTLWRWKMGALLQLTDTTAAQHREEALEAALQEQRALTLALTEVSSPVLPVMRQTILLPLVGSLDQSRMAAIADALLSGIKAHRARLVILDLTGVSQLSLEAVDALRQAIDAMCLLGAEPILAGIQAQVAETLGSSDLDLRTLSIHSNLQAGLEYAAQAL